MTKKKNNTSYLGNTNLKAAGVKVDFTKKQVEEYLKCSKDPVYFIKTYIKIVSLDEGLVPFDMWDFQEDIIEKVHNNRFVIAKLPRQTGKSTTMISYLLHYVLFNQDVNVAILANKLATARELLHRLQLAYEYLPKWMQQGISEWNKGSIELENGSKILASATSSSAVRGGSFNMIFLDEFAYVPHGIAEEFFSSVYPTISSGQTTKVLMVSTPKGLNMFYRFWVDATEGRNEYVPIEVHWSQVPGRDEEWKKQTIANTSEDQFQTEFECDFVGSSSTLISTHKLKCLAYKTPLQKNDDGLSIYQEPKKDNFYCVIVDTARGQGKDYSAFVVIDMTKTPYKVVATYRNNEISPMVYPTVINAVARKYNDAFVFVEINDIGGQVADILHADLEYDNMLMTVVKGRKGQVLSSGFGKGSQLGIRTTSVTKRIGCATIKSLIEEDKIIIEDIDTINELTTFVAKRNSYEADDGHNDDLAMCLVIFGWMTTQPYFGELMDIDIRKDLYGEKIKQVEDDMLPFGFIDGGTEQSFEIDTSGQVWFIAE
ncbi:MAG: terminase [Candidatus Marinimicrobia bacterium]|nr:terminase [Candidatus Neomarinimicrobiota bacterium]